MFAIRRFAAVLALLLASLGPAGASERIMSFLSDVIVERNGDLQVTETIMVDAQGNKIRHGILRDFPTTYVSRHHVTITVGFDVEAVLRDGKPEKYTLEKLGNGVRIRIGRADTELNNGPHEFVIKYHTTRQIGYFPNFDELYWNVTGLGWTFPIDQAEARITLPEQVPIVQTALYTGRYGSTDQDAAVVEQVPGRIVFRTTAPLGAFEGLTVAAAWRKGVLLPPPGPGFFERAGTWLHDTIVSSWVWQHLPLTLAMLGLPLVLGYYAYSWVTVGGSMRAGTVIPQFTPPKGMSAAAVRYVRRMNFDEKTFVAALLDLAAHRRVEMVGEKDYVRVDQCKNGKPVGPAETVAEERLFHKHSTIPFVKRYAPELESAMNGLRATLKKTYNDNAFSENISRPVWGLLASIALIISVVLANWTRSGDLFSSTLFVALFMLPLCMLGLLVINIGRQHWAPGSYGGSIFVMLFGLVMSGTSGYLMIWLMFAYRENWTEIAPTAAAMALAPFAVVAFPMFRLPTVDGRKLMDAIEGFRLYLGTAEEERLKAFYPPKKTPELFEQYLPYAVALDVENEWAKGFEGIIDNALLEETETEFSFGSGKQSRNPGRIVDFVNTTLSSSLTETVASSSSPPGTSGERSGSSSDSSSSGSSGGGSSGGGGGGGGGSGW
jgi:uncharacterized membrane protein YgcG